MSATPLPQDLHIHTTWSRHDSSVVPEQTAELVKRVGHAQTVGISDHFEHFADRDYDRYVAHLRGLGLWVGTEVDGSDSAAFASSLHFDYYIYHCRDTAADYRGVETLVATGRPVIIAHPNALDTDLSRVAPEALVEINNRYIWRCDWMAFYRPHRDRFGFVIGSDAHQPLWLGQAVARRAAAELEIAETLLVHRLEAHRPARTDGIS